MLISAENCRNPTLNSSRACPGVGPGEINIFSINTEASELGSGTAPGPAHSEERYERDTASREGDQDFCRTTPVLDDAGLTSAMVGSVYACRMDSWKEWRGS